MPAIPQDSSPERRKERRKVRDRDHDKDKEKDRERERKHRSTQSQRSTSTKDNSISKTSLSSGGSRRKSSMPGILEEQTELSNADGRAKSSYPSLSREHAKESLGPRPELNLFTPPSTDINASKEKLANLNRIINNGPPSPPLTDRTAGQPRSSTARPVTVDTIIEEDRKENSGSDTGSSRRIRTRPAKSKSLSNKTPDSTSPVSKVRSRKETGSTTPLKDKTNGRVPSTTTSQNTRTVSPPRDDSGSEQATNTSSDATSIAPEQPSIQRPGSKIPQPQHPPPVQPVHYLQPQVIPVESFSRQQTPVDIVIEPDSAFNTPSSAGGPPPPPPPPNVPIVVPRVDYLLQHGGLTHTVPKNLLYAGKPMAVQQAAISSPSQQPIFIANLFEPYSQLLQDYEKVVSKNGSLAVATGYRSVARRLLDRLEAVFARDLSAEICTCSICGYEDDETGDIRGVSWGEILELVSGRKDLPSWPPFAFEPKPQGLGLNFDLAAPMQKLDIDVPEEYRDHYIRQSQKTKQSVDRWLNRQQGNQHLEPAPQEVDDETLTFAILTHIPGDQRPIFKELLGIVDLPPEPPRRAPSPERESGQPPRPVPTPMPRKVRPEYVIAAGIAIQRLYRLSAPPRDPETALYLLHNPTLHHPLATLAAVSSDEWEILISGRFDGFLRSGAEDDFPGPWPQAGNGRYTPQQISRMPSRGATPAYNSARMRQNSGGSYQYPRPATAPGYRSVSGIDAGKAGPPIALDEETEIATLAEIERDIYTGMEALEDAFEHLHLRAEAVRRALRERSAGLAAAQQRRKQSDIEIRAGTPASAFGAYASNENWEVETDDGIADDVSELAPDDSASNISSNRRRKHKRRNERRTPVVGAIDEEDESEGYMTRESSPEKR
ncbi:hypothetical protein LTR64_005634 [Lithohypha guttulata]|uniref:uncharacterized protein n=1 Tax=Lithohypha guttulata TaxID=1690604 RepID=UPI002DDFA746|nr:hypothetical protein LTR51_002572 [Lithohypha guttulata]